MGESPAYNNLYGGESPDYDDSYSKKNNNDESYGGESPDYDDPYGGESANFSIKKERKIKNILKNKRKTQQAMLASKIANLSLQRGKLGTRR